MFTYRTCMPLIQVKSKDLSARPQTLFDWAVFKDKAYGLSTIGKDFGSAETFIAL